MGALEPPTSFLIKLITLDPDEEDGDEETEEAEDEDDDGDTEEATEPLPGAE